VQAQPARDEARRGSPRAAAPKPCRAGADEAGPHFHPRRIAPLTPCPATAARLTVTHMFPPNWTEHRRGEDRELLGYLAPEDDAAHRPMTVFGNPLAATVTREHAEHTLDATRLSYLAGRWLLRRQGHDPITVQIVEATPDSVTVANVDYRSNLNYGHQFTLGPPSTPTL